MLYFIILFLAQANYVATKNGEDASKPPSPNTAMMLVSHAIQKVIFHLFNVLK